MKLKSVILLLQCLQGFQQWERVPYTMRSLSHRGGETLPQGKICMDSFGLGCTLVHTGKSINISFIFLTTKESYHETFKET